MKRIILTLYAILLILGCFAQQDAMFTHYSFNTNAVNPGYAGSRGALSAIGVHRTQWAFFPGAPATQTFNIHAPLANDKLGLGVSFLKDVVGPISQTGLNIDFAYRLKLGDGILAFGLKTGVNIRSAKLATEVVVIENNDQAFQSNINSQLMPVFGAGLYYSNNRFYAGISSPNLVATKFNSNTTVESKSASQQHLFFIAGAIFDLNGDKTIKLKPTAFLKTTYGVKPVLDLTTLFYFNEKIWCGPMYRSSKALGLLTGIKIKDQFELGYSFDWSFGNRTATYNAGSHEIMIRFDFDFKDNGTLISPRYF